MDLCATPAVELARLIRARELSAAELLAAVLARIDEANPAINAIVTLAAEQASAAAAGLDARAARGSFAGPLHGLPIAVKDLAETAGIRTTFGSPLFASFVPDFDAPHVARLKQAGAVVIGKTNTPEFGAGSQTFNPVFGPTRNPYDTRLTPGGSSGGAAAAVAAGLIPFADGSDLAASVRNPASFCGLVGLRTTPGLVPADLFDPLGVVGPIARTAPDAALLLAGMCGTDPGLPLARPDTAGRLPRPAAGAAARAAGGLDLRPGRPAGAAGGPGRARGVPPVAGGRRVRGDRRRARPGRRGRGLPGAAGRPDGRAGAAAARPPRPGQGHPGLEHREGHRAARGADRGGAGRPRRDLPAVQRPSWPTGGTRCSRCPRCRWSRSRSSRSG